VSTRRAARKAKDITVSISEYVYRKAQIPTTELGKSLSPRCGFLNLLPERQIELSRLEAKQTHRPARLVRRRRLYEWTVVLATRIQTLHVE
jgi:hypothetical protein